MSSARTTRLLGAALICVLPLIAAASEDYVIVIRDHRFEPATLEVPAGRALTLVVKNMDATPEEFESHDLDREKIVPPGQQVIIRIDALKPGSYTFVGEFHEDTAKGTLVAR